jgi:hypothetical protein
MNSVRPPESASLQEESSFAYHTSAETLTRVGVRAWARQIPLSIQVRKRVRLDQS